MSIFIDTADIEQAKAAKESGWIHGITTNPILLSNSGSSASDTLQQLAELNIGLLFYQLISTGKENMLKEAQLAKEIAGDQLVLKLPPTKQGFQIIPVSSSGNSMLRYGRLQCCAGFSCQRVRCSVHSCLC